MNFLKLFNKEKEMLKVLLLKIFRTFVSKSKDVFQVKFKKKKTIIVYFCILIILGLHESETIQYFRNYCFALENF